MGEWMEDTPWDREEREREFRSELLPEGCDAPSMYILDEDGRTPVPATPLEYMEWRERQSNSLGRVARTWIGDTLVSTVFLAIDCKIEPSGPPVLFETAVLGGKSDGETVRYCAYEQALRGHSAAVAIVVREQRRERWWRAALMGCGAVIVAAGIGVGYAGLPLGSLFGLVGGLLLGHNWLRMPPPATPRDEASQ